MDPLSDLLSLMQARSLLSSRFEGRGRWAMQFPAYVSQIKFGGVLEGRLWLSTGEHSAWLERGDFYLLANGHPFVVASDPSLHARDGVRLYRSLRAQGDGVVRLGHAGELVALASGHFQFDKEPASTMLLHSLPPLICLRGTKPGASPLVALLELLRYETSAEEAETGAAAARNSLATLILVQALRVFLGGSTKPSGWLSVLGDRRISRALTAAHADIARPWVLPELAALAGMSRSAFAQRFRELSGMTPLDYLQQWRLSTAKRALCDSDESIGRIAHGVGYLSETAFSAAFKRMFGESPGRFRSASRAAVLSAA